MTLTNLILAWLFMCSLRCAAVLNSFSQVLQVYTRTPDSSLRCSSRCRESWLCRTNSSPHSGQIRFCKGQKLGCLWSDHSHGFLYWTNLLLLMQHDMRFEAGDAGEPLIADRAGEVRCCVCWLVECEVKLHVERLRTVVTSVRLPRRNRRQNRIQSSQRQPYWDTNLGRQQKSCRFPEVCNNLGKMVTPQDVKLALKFIFQQTNHSKNTINRVCMLGWLRDSRVSERLGVSHWWLEANQKLWADLKYLFTKSSHHTWQSEKICREDCQNIPKIQERNTRGIRPKKTGGCSCCQSCFKYIPSWDKSKHFRQYCTEGDSEECFLPKTTP